MAVTIHAVHKGSPAEFAGISSGEMLLSINGNEIIDVLDYRFYETDPKLILRLRGKNGAERDVFIRKGQYEAIGLEFETYLMDKQHSCRNRCIFCFIDQLPKGMRETLYFKDDDSRLSFLFGNYITLTNLSGHEVDRIIKMHISPINISVHTTNPELRVKMMGNRFAGEALGILKRFADAGIKMNCQLVLCPGVNDGQELERTLSDLKALSPAVQSIAVVPVGVTKFREGLYPMKTYDATSAAEVINIMERFGDEFEKELGDRVAYPADEFYLIAGKELPPAEYYGDFLQLENGVGLLASLKQEFLDALEDVTPLKNKRRVTIVTGEAAAPFLDSLLDELRRKCNNLTCNVIPIRNDFFGTTIVVAGLVTGGDIIRQLKGKELGDVLLLPSAMLRQEGDVFLDDVSLDDLRRALCIEVVPVRNDGYELLEAVVGSDTFCQNQ